MRDDMSKVIVERPRLGSRARLARRSRRQDPKQIEVNEEADNALPARIGHGRAARMDRIQKSLNENLAPLRRYLEGQVGRPWDKVFSDISANMRLDNAVQKHVRDHVKDFVATTTVLQDGEIYVMDRYGRMESLAQMRWPIGLYVHPVTGMLCRNDWRRTRRMARRRQDDAGKRALTARMRPLARDRQLHLLEDGNWWDVQLAELPSMASLRDVEDVIERAGLSSVPRAERYDRWGVYACSMRALSRREIRARGLRR